MRDALSQYAFVATALEVGTVYGLRGFGGFPEITRHFTLLAS